MGFVQVENLSALRRQETLETRLPLVEGPLVTSLSDRKNVISMREFWLRARLPV